MPFTSAVGERPIFNVVDYGADPTGTRDSLPAFNGASLDCHKSAPLGGIVFIPAGTFLLNSYNQQSGTRYYCVNFYEDQVWMGSGRDSTTVKLGNNVQQFTDTRIFSSDSSDGTYTVDGTTFMDFTLDCNGANQTTAGVYSQVGISSNHTSYIRHDRMRVINAKADATHEGTCYDSYNSFANSYIQCEATGAEGFSATQSTGIRYTDCSSYSSASWHGFTQYNSYHSSYINCYSFLNNQRGFNSESCYDAHYVNCVAGMSTNGTGVSGPYAINTLLGNTGDGFYAFNGGRLNYHSCMSRSNGQNGLYISGAVGVRVEGGTFVSNTGAGIKMAAAADAVSTMIHNANTGGNANAMVINATNYSSMDHGASLTAPAIPATATAIQNPFPLDMQVFINGGTVSAVGIGSTSTTTATGIAATGRNVLVPAGAWITLTYSSAPTWTWFVNS